MKSHEVIRQATDGPGVKSVAAAMKLSPALVYKWCEAPSLEDEQPSGAKNPLDRVRDLYELTKDPMLIRWLCNQADGFFVANCAPPAKCPPEQNVLAETRAMVREFSDLLDAVTESVTDDSSIDTAEALDIRQKWEDLKCCVEHFVIGCEKGVYLTKRAR